MRLKALVAITAVLMAACGSGVGSPEAPVSGVRSCNDIELPSAPEDWYDDEPVYVGNEMPVDAIRAFSSSLDGYVDIWIDRNHNGWVTVGFVDADVESHQAALEAQFPDDGVVAVQLPFTPEELDRVAVRLQTELPDDMDARNVDYLRGSVMVYGGLLTDERVALIEDAVGSDPVCIDGIDPSMMPDRGPQQASGEGWLFLGVVDDYVGEVPVAISDQESLKALWDSLSLAGEAPVVDFESHVAVAFPLGYSGSCPDTRFDGFVVEGDRVMPLIAHITVAQGCTDDYNPRTYVVAVERDVFPSPPFHLVEWEHSSRALRVDVDLRVPGQAVGDGVAEVDIDRPRRATEMPLVIETGFPWTITIDAECDPSYLGEINGVGWHAELGSLPSEWADSEVDGLIDLELLLAEGPNPSLTASAGGVQVVYEPGDNPQPGCVP